MPLFEYRGLTSTGKNTRGTVDADNVRLARARLKKDGIFVSEISDKGKTRAKKSQKAQGNSKVGIEDLALMTRQLASLLKANIPLVDSLTAVSEQVENPKLADAIADIKNMVNEGQPLHRGLNKYNKIFDNIYIVMVEAGEATGTLETILMRLADFKESQAAIKAKVNAALVYPVVMMLFTLLMLSGMFIFIIPQIQEVFASMEMVLPWFTEIVIAASGIFVNYWYLLIAGVVGIFLLFKAWKNSEEGSKTFDTLLLKLPIAGKLARMIAVSRFTRTLSTLLTGGVPMLNALDIVKRVVDNHVLAVAIEEARDNINEGESIAGPLKRSGHFPPIVIHMINIGEKTGELEQMLTQVSESYDFEVKNRLQAITALVEPFMIIFMAAIIGSIVFSIMVPMFDMAKLGA